LLLAAVGALLNLGISGCGNSEEFVFTQGAVANPNVPPTANLDNYLSVGNAPLSIPAARGVLANDELNGGGISSFQSTGAAGGTVQLADDGSFTYSPPFGFTGSDTFTYTLANSVGESSTTVTISMQNLAFFVDNTAPDGGDGSFNNRFNQMSQATAAAGPNDFIAVFRGDGTNRGLAGTIELQNGQKLIGEGVGFTADAALLLRSDEVNSQTILPAGDPPVLTGPVLLADDNLVAGFLIDGSGSDGIFGDSITGATIENNEFQNYTESGIDLLNVSGDLEILRCTFHQVAMRDGVTLSNTNTDADLTINGNTFTDDGAETRSCADIVVDANSTLDFVCNDNQVLFESEVWFRGFLLTSNGASTFRADGNIIEGDGISGLSAATLESTGSIDLTWTDNSIVGGKEMTVRAFDGSKIEGEIRGNTVDTEGELGQEGIAVSLADDRVDGEGSSANLTIAENTLTGAESGHNNSSDLGDLECGITVQARTNSVFNSTIEGNVISGWRHGIWFIGEGFLFSEISIINNNVSNAEYSGILVTVPQVDIIGQLRADISMNTVSGSGDSGIDVIAGLISQVEVALRSNNATGNAGNDIRVATTETTAEMCAAITDNRSDELIIEESGGTLGVERLDVANGGPLQTVNTITAGMATIIGSPVGLMPDTCLGSLID
jgi:hypothetical protein